MICDVCGKNQATVHLTEIIDDQMTELHLCEECARQKSSQMESQFGLGDLLAGLAEFEKPQTKEKETPLAKCPSCGLTYTDFKKIGRLGCGDCYTAFKKYLGPLLKRIHGSNIHVGKVPAKAAAVVGIQKKKSIAYDLRQQLQEAVNNEEFEKAAKLRDQIREIERSQTSDEKNRKEPK